MLPQYQRQLWDPECDVSPAPPAVAVVGGAPLAVRTQATLTRTRGGDASSGGNGGDLDLLRLQQRRN